jgi:ketosteroid isomerase-like protein
MMNARELMNAHFASIQGDLGVWSALFADDAIMDLPYAPPQLGSPLRGREAILLSVKGFLDSLRDVEIHVARTYAIEGQDAAIAEFTMSATVIPTGKAYHQQYITYIRGAAGKIAEYREYFDPTRLIAAFSA